MGVLNCLKWLYEHIYIIPQKTKEMTLTKDEALFTCVIRTSVKHEKLTIKKGQIVRASNCHFGHKGLVIWIESNPVCLEMITFVKNFEIIEPK